MPTKKNMKTMKNVKKTRKPARKAATRRTQAVRKKVSPIPKGYTTVTPYLHVRNAAGAIEFYKKAFGAKEKVRMLGPDGSVMHAEMVIGTSVFMLGDENLQMGVTAPETVGGTAGGIMLYVTNVDRVFAAAVAAGATVTMPVADQFWGDRYGQLKDPFGHKWSVATHIEDLTPKEMKRRGDEFMKQFAQQS